MGQEIVYCFKCQKRILGTDFAKGLAFQLENNCCCSACAVLVMETLPPKAKEQLLGKMFKATQEHGSTRGKSGPVREVTTRRIPIVTLPPAVPRAPSGTPSTALVVGIGAAVAAVLVLVVMLSSGNSTAPIPPSTAVVKRPATPDSAPDSGPSAEERRRAGAAKDALRKAREFALAHPKDFAGQIQQWSSAVLDAERTGYEADARRELERTRSRATEATAQEIAEFERETRKLTDRKEFKTAFDSLARERLRRAQMEWSSALDRIEREVREAAARLFSELKGKAVAARDRGAQDQVAAARAEVARWGLPDLVAELEAALDLPWRPIFDGRTLNGFAPGLDNAWRVEDGVLIHDNTVDNAAVTRELFGDGEIRVRFEIRGSSLLSFRFRLDGKGLNIVNWPGPVLETFSDGVHELVFSARNDTVSATLDGKAQPVEKVGQPHAGMIQFNTSGGSLRIKSLEFRPFR